MNYFSWADWVCLIMPDVLATASARSMIFYRLKCMDRLDLLLGVRTPPDWHPAGWAGPRELKAHIKEP